MVKGITRQVVVVKSPDERLFEQAIFLVKDSALSEGEITEEALLQEARLACRRSDDSPSWLQRFIWSGVGAGCVAVAWALTAIL